MKNFKLDVFTRDEMSRISQSHMSIRNLDSYSYDCYFCDEASESGSNKIEHSDDCYGMKMLAKLSCLEEILDNSAQPTSDPQVFACKKSCKSKVGA